MDSEQLKKRLNKYISETGVCSRRGADKLIEAGKVLVNGEIPELGTRVDDSDAITIDGKPLNDKEKYVYIAFNKPIGITCTTEKKVNDNIVDFINYPKRIYPIGRLDKPSEGLIFLTNHGDIINKILRAGNNHEKEYIVTVDQVITNEFIERMSNGVPVLDTITKKCTVTKISKNIFKIVLTQGLNRQIRRMCAHLGYKVIRLQRTRIMNVNLGIIPIGKWRNLTKDELSEIFRLISESSKTEEASL
ncbi:MAG: 23S rRNA pseudouridine(2604) synthase RluF [Salinivirgaceae bacterium]|jgi:23S rRNA pseudouridine2604 synthase|nr:23S rRNA pseudouridine(2604) synthase RluF [Salinivirgaceae bacterium]